MTKKCSVVIKQFSIFLASNQIISSNGKIYMVLNFYFCYIYILNGTYFTFIVAEANLEYFVVNCRNVLSPMKREHFHEFDKLRG